MIALCIIYSYAKAQVKSGPWHGEFTLNASLNLMLPFNFDLQQNSGNYIITIYNAEESIIVNEITVSKDSLNFKMPVFDSEFRTKIIGDSILKGIWINHSKKENNIIVFTARRGEQSRFSFESKKITQYCEGKWEVTFSKGTSDSAKAIGLFKNENKKVTGTFLAETGDYRYLEGVEDNGHLKLSCFDGAHCFLFEADVDDRQITNGRFYSGTNWIEPWIGKRNGAFKLRDPEKLTYAKQTKETVNFTFKDGNGQTVSLSDSLYKNKVVIVQIMGSWCPNCMDETKYLANLYERCKRSDLEIIGIAYERTADPVIAAKNIARLKKRFGVNYQILLSGLTGKQKASESLPFLNGIMAFPTTIILTKAHTIAWVYTGFNGPATGKKYDDYIYKTEKLINHLIK